MPVRTAAAAMMAVALLVVAPAASARTLVVDDDRLDCPNAEYDSVRDAVADAAPTGDTVAICPGRYREAGGVTIDKSLTLMGAGADRVRIEPLADLRAPTGIFEPRDDVGNVITAKSPGGPVAISGVTVAGGDASDPRGAEAAIVFDNTNGSVSRSRVTDVVPANTQDYSSNVGYGVVAFGDTPGGYTFSLKHTLVERYAKGGVLLSAPGGGITIDGTVEDSIIRGNGPRSEPGQGQNGIQVSREGARATIRRNSIADHRFLADESASVGVLLYDVANPAQTQITNNDFRGNGYGVFNAAENLCDAAVAVPAPSNYWGNPAGPTPDFSSQTPLNCPPPVYAPTGDPALGDRVNGIAVDFTDPDQTPHGTPVAPGPEPDLAPRVQITGPANDTAAQPGSNVTVTATATDDFDVKRVDFVRNGTVVDSDTNGPPYAAQVTAPAAGASAAITVVGYDSAGQSTADSISLRGTAAATPRAPAAEDRPPRVAFTSPAPFSSIDPRAVPPLTANASDDNGVARVVFLDDGQQVCEDRSAPFTCAYRPTGADVGRNTLIAVAQDRAGQTAAAFRPVRVGKFQPAITARTTPGRDRRRPYRYRTSGRLVLPAGVTPAQACASGGIVQVQFAAGRLKLPLLAAIRPDCTFRASIVFPSRRPLGRRGRLSVTTRFDGNDILGAARAKKQRVRAG